MPTFHTAQPFGTEQAATARRHHPLVITLHWLTALLVIANPLLVWLTEDIADKALRGQLVNLHKSIGVTVLLLVAVRLIVRQAVSADVSRDWLSPRLYQLSRLGHLALYLLLILVPVSGWLMSNTFGAGVPFFGLFDMPVLLGKDKPLNEVFHEVHELAANALLIFAAGHAALAIVHHLHLRDATLASMLPFLRPPERGERQR